MKKFDKKVVFLVSAAVIITAGFLSGYFLYDKEFNFNGVENILQIGAEKNIKSSAKSKQQNKTVAKNPDIKTNENTKMIYEYYYTTDGITKIKEETVPTELVNKTKKNIENIFDEWSVLSFNSDEVVLRKNIAGSSEINYILKEYNGFVAVFYNIDNSEELKEITKTPISVLPENEQNLLKKGISVQGNKNLIKILQDYES